MSGPSTSSSTLESLFQTALQRYEAQTGEKLIDHPLAQQLEQCTSADFITEVLQDQARAFNEFRRVESKVMKPLKGVVHILYTLSTNTTLRKAIGLVRQIVHESIYFFRRCFYSHFPLRRPYP
jgi:hypothetical protein